MTAGPSPHHAAGPAGPPLNEPEPTVRAPDPSLEDFAVPASADQAAPAAPAAVTAPASAPVLRVRRLDVEFNTEAGVVPAVRGLSYEVHPGEVLAIVGESGSGKSVSSLAVMGLLPGNARIGAELIEFDGIDLRGSTPPSCAACADAAWR